MDTQVALKEETHIHIHRRAALTDEEWTDISISQSPGTAGKRRGQTHSPSMLPSMGHTCIQPEAPGTDRVLGQDAL